MRHSEALGETVDERTLMPDWYAREKRLAHMLPYVSLVDDHTVRTRANELFQCIRLSGVNSYTTDDTYLDKVTALFARIIAQLGPEFSYYVHKVSKSITPDLLPVRGDGFAAAVDDAWRAKLASAGLRDKTLTLTIIHRPPPRSFLGFVNRSAPERFREETAKRIRRLKEAVGVFTSGLAELKPRILSAASGELVGFLGALNTGRELPLYPANRYGFLAYNVANTRVTFLEDHFELSDGVVGHRFGKSFTIGEYAEGTTCTMFDMLNLPVDMIVTHSFTPINSNLMAGRIKRQKRQMQASQDAALSLLEALDIAHDDLEAKRQSFGAHHMVVTVFCDSLDELQTLGAEIVNAAAAEGVKMIGERMAAKSHYFSQHPGNQPKRVRASAVTNRNFADFAALHRTQLGKEKHQLPWGQEITLFPTPEQSAYRFSYHEQGSPEKEPTGGHTLILGRPGSGKSVLSAFLMTQARRVGARIFVFDYRLGMEMAVRANGGRYASIKAGQATGLNPLWTEIDERGTAWLSDWLASLLYRSDKPLTPAQTNRIQEVVRQNATAGNPALRNWKDFASLFVSTDDSGDLHQRLLEWTEDGRYGWIFGQSFEDTFSLDGDVVGFDLTGILDSESEKERMAVLSYLFRRIEREIEDRRPTIIVIDEAWKALDNPYFAERLSNWLVTARKQNTVAVMMTQYASQLERTRTGKTIVEAVPTQILLPNIRAHASDYAMLNLFEKELDVLLNTGSDSRLALIRDDSGSVVVDADLSALGPLLTILGGMEKGEALVGPGYRDRPDFWRLS
ncbi:MAG: type IV secretion system protein B4 [Marivita sp.]|jgi:type IV secretion system protein VirB4|uniref:VirB4 family type IV secretion/conjugal transfer ATPase n=1 Tax=Roseobacteraceae TaxID=2854170 RepID=UPI000B526BBE|nr:MULTISPECIES: type IV secretion system protein B4 [Roseobacteraceae]MCI5112681.1 type IV secretion system protein B4 [Marivita sp.]OWU81220.1 type IV secretion system protein B4 [Oceanicola sp. 22II-s10i]